MIVTDIIVKLFSLFNIRTFVILSRVHDRKNKLPPSFFTDNYKA